MVDIEILRLSRKGEQIEIKKFSNAVKLQGEIIEWQNGVYDDKKSAQ